MRPNPKFLVQIMQAMATKIETETYRVKRMSGEIKGIMGTLFSQLNDVWQAPTWSSIGNKIFLKLLKDFL